MRLKMSEEISSKVDKDADMAKAVKAEREIPERYRRYIITEVAETDSHPQVRE